ncbi:ATP-grasp domain-containing protein [Tepidibacillus sp. LV47]|uniref:ATP-grasp domain-containing protein n=1 Tax=Tepidibacillus sp. LV47 TaxID=3398228 RepID=UPI003AAC3D10
MKNILVLNRINYKHYLREGQPILNPAEYKVFFFTKKEKIYDIPKNHVAEIYAMDINNDEMLFEIANIVHKHNPINHVISLSERTMCIAGKLRDLFGCSGLSYEQTLKFRDKYIMKKALVGSGINLPAFQIPTCIEDIVNFLNVYGSIILKPRLGMGSQNTYKLNNISEIIDVTSREGFHFEDYIMEEFIDGDMYHCDSIVQGNEVIVSSVSKYLNSTMSYQKECYLASVMDDSANSVAIKELNEKVIKTLGLDNGVTHLEVFRKKDGSIYFCEIAARIGGAGVVPSFKASYSISLIDAAICLEVGMDLPEIRFTGDISGWIVFHSKKGIVRSVADASLFDKEWIKEFRINAKKGDFLSDSKFSSDSIASFIITGNNSKEVGERIEWIKQNFFIEYDEV